MWPSHLTEVRLSGSWGMLPLKYTLRLLLFDCLPYLLLFFGFYLYSLSLIDDSLRLWASTAEPPPAD